jgi:translation initiation factor 1
MRRLVYDSEVGRVDDCPTCGRRSGRCVCDRPGRRARAGGDPAASAPRDGVVRVMRDRKRRGGKVVTMLTGLPAATAAATATELKRLCGSGGTVKGDVVEIQGDHRERVADFLRARGYTVKLAGG